MAEKGKQGLQRADTSQAKRRSAYCDRDAIAGVVQVGKKHVVNESQVDMWLVKEKAHKRDVVSTSSREGGNAYTTAELLSQSTFGKHSCMHCTIENRRIGQRRETNKIRGKSRS